MKFKGPMLVIKDMERSKDFYTRVLGLKVISDYGANATFTGGLSVQSEESWCQFTNCDKSFFSYGSNSYELYFEEDNIEEFIEHLKKHGVSLLEGLSEMPWGQKIVRFYDPDCHIIEVGENMTFMMKRLFDSGMSVEQLEEKTFIKKGIIKRMLKL